MTPFQNGRAETVLEDMVVVARRDGEAGKQEGDFAISLPGGRGYEDVLASIPNVQQGTPSSTAFALRGLGQDNVIFLVGTESNSLVNVSTGGISGSYATLACMAPMMWDIDKVALIRGPVLFGSGVMAMGGELDMEPTPPQFRHEGKFTAEAAEYGTWRGGITENVVLVPDRLALRLNLAAEGTDGYVTNLFDGNDKYAATSQELFRGQLRYRPNGDDEAVYDLRVEAERAGGNTFGQSLLVPGHGLYERIVNVSFTPSLPADRLAMILKGRMELGGGWWMDGAASYQKLDGTHTTDFDDTSVLNWMYAYTADESRLTGSLRVGRDWDRFHWTGGIYGEAADYGFTFAGQGLGPVPAGRPFWNQTDEALGIAALHSNAEWEYADHFWLTGGLRLDYQARTQETYATLDGAVRGRGRVEVDHAEWLPKLGTEWRQDGTTAGVSVARLYRPPGAAVATSLGISQAYGAERGWELDGYAEHKWEHLSASARAFLAAVDGQQVPYTAPGGFPVLDNFVTNGASSRRCGAEVEMSWRDGPFGASLTAGYLNTDFETLVLHGVNRAGQSFPFAPEWTLGAAVAWKPATGWFGEAACNWADTSYCQVDSPVATKLEPHALVSARAGYKWSCLELYAFGSNLLDEDYASSKTDFSSVGLPLSARLGMPRMLGMGMTLSW